MQALALHTRKQFVVIHCVLYSVYVEMRKNRKGVSLHSMTPCYQYSACPKSNHVRINIIDVPESASLV